MRSNLLKGLIALLGAILAGALMALAQDFNPTSPPEPQTLSKLSVVASPAGVARTTGTGRYVQGTRVYINASAIDTDYRFVRWEKDGKTISTSRSMYYTTGGSDETLTAVYEYVVFDPTSPDEPRQNYMWKLYLDSDPEEGCSFSLDNGSRHLAGEKLSITAYPNQGFVFDGWYMGELKYSDELTIPYTMPRSDARLRARFTFIPDSPDEPTGGNQTNVDNKVNYDVNRDGVVNATDATSIISVFLTDSMYLRRYDVNSDGAINVSDVTEIISEFLAK